MGNGGDNNYNHISVLTAGYGPDFSEAIRDYFCKSGFISVKESDNTLQALNILKEGDFDAIVAEYCTTDFSEKKLLQNIRKDGIKIPVIIFTEDCCEATVTEAFRAGADFFVRKSGDPAEYFAELSGKIKFAAERYKSSLRANPKGKKAGISRELLFKMLSHNPDMISVQDSGMNIIYSNKEVSATVLEDVDNLNGGFYGTYGSELSPDCLAAEVFASGEPVQREVELPDDTFVDLRAIPILNEENKTEFIVRWVRDITEKKRYEKELISRKNLFEEIFNKIPDVIAIQYPDHKIDCYNNAGYNLLNMAEDEVRNRECYSLIGRDFECTECATRNAVISGKMERVEKFVPEIGRYLDCMSIPVLDEEGNVVRIIEHLRDVTDNKTAETELRKSEEDYRSLYKMMRMICDNVPDLIWAKDIDKRYIFANEAVCRKLLDASDTSEPIGKTDLYFAERERASHPDDPNWNTFGEICRDTDQITIDSGIPCQFDEYGNVKGEFLYLDVHKAPLLNEDGEMIGTVGSGRDVTKLKRTEGKLLESEGKIGLILDAINDAIWEWDVSSGKADFTSTWYTMLGFEPYEFPPSYETWKSLVHPDDITNAEERIKDCIINGHGGYYHEFRMRRKDGTYRWISSRGDVLSCDFDGKPLKMVGIHTDITDRKNALLSLARSEKKYREVFENSVAGLFKTSAEGEIFDINHSLAHIYGFSNKEELLNSGINADDIYVDSSERSRILKIIENEGQLKNYESMQRRKDGSPFWVSINCRLIPDEESNMHFYEGTVIDVTERKKAEEALDLANRKLKILSGITRHDILNQITVIRGIVDIFGDLEDGPEKEEYLGEIYSAAVSIQKNIGFTRKYEKIGVKKPIWFNIPNLVRNRNIQINYHCSGIEIYADSMFKKVFENFLDNTLRHGEGATEVNVRCRRGINKGELVLTWEDNGAGVPDDQKEVIFSKGFGKNTGLGLFLSREVLSITGITIRENGVYGEGALFELSVPADSWRYKEDNVGNIEI